MKRIRTTQQQREVIALLKTRFAEQGYLIYPVVEWYRKHRLDFVAVPKDCPQKFVLVRPMRNGSISVRPFCDPALYKKAREFLTRAKKSATCPIRWSDRTLPYARQRPDWWHSYLPSSAKREFGEVMRSHSLFSQACTGPH